MHRYRIMVIRDQVEYFHELMKTFMAPGYTEHINWTGSPFDIYHADLTREEVIILKLAIAHTDIEEYESYKARISSMYRVYVDKDQDHE